MDHNVVNQTSFADRRAGTMVLKVPLVRKRRCPHHAIVYQKLRALKTFNTIQQSWNRSWVGQLNGSCLPLISATLLRPPFCRNAKTFVTACALKPSQKISKKQKSDIHARTSDAKGSKQGRRLNNRSLGGSITPQRSDWQFQIGKLIHIDHMNQLWKKHEVWMIGPIGIITFGFILK